MPQNYNRLDKASVLSFAKKIKDKSLREVCDESILEHNYSGKGNFGQILEKYYFQYEPNSDSEADFSEINLELKATPLKQLKNRHYRSKERLVLNIINYLEIVDQDFVNSTFWKKNSNLLLIFYLHNFSQDILDYVIKLVDEWNFPKNDLEIIKRDWEKIKKKIVDGNAHELSEGDTLYLGACTKGGKGGNERTQPFNKKLAKQRAFSLKQGYVNHIIATIANNPGGNYGKLITSQTEIMKRSLEEIQVTLGANLNRSAKNFYASLTKLILGIGPDQEIEEFEKADIIVKSIRLKENDFPKENISFPNFKFEEIIKENWETSEFKNILEHKFLFVFYKYVDNSLVLRKVKFWNMPYRDILQVEKVWTKAKNIIERGEIVNRIVGGIRYTNFPNKKFSNIAHVRPHATNSDDTYPLPIADKVTFAHDYTKHCFWLNNNYIRDEIYLK